MHFELSSLIVWIALWIVNTYSEFLVHILSNNGDIKKCHRFCTTTTTTTDNDDAIAICRVFYKNSRVMRTWPIRSCVPSFLFYPTPPKIQRVQCCSYSGSMNYESNISPLSQAGPRRH